MDYLEEVAEDAIFVQWVKSLDKSNMSPHRSALKAGLVLPVLIGNRVKHWKKRYATPLSYTTGPTFTGGKKRVWDGGGSVVASENTCGTILQRRALHVCSMPGDILFSKAFCPSSVALFQAKL